MNIPLVRESKNYSENISNTLIKKNIPIYFLKRYCNYIVKFDEKYEKKQVEKFIQDPRIYLNTTELEKDFDIVEFLERKLQWQTVAKMLTKVIVHMTFRFIGRLQGKNSSLVKGVTARKCYVEVSERTFDNKDVDRYIYPFPLSAIRQFEYVRSLAKCNINFIFTGNAYLYSDVFRFIIKRNFSSLMNLESRASMRHAIEYYNKGYSFIECTDEYDVTSLDFCRLARRKKITMHNSSHGVGNYLPYHSYDIFSVLLNNQIVFHSEFVKDCTYRIRKIPCEDVPIKNFIDGTAVVFLGQVQKRSTYVEQDIEIGILDILSEVQKEFDTTLFFYKPHPNALNASINNTKIDNANNDLKFTKYSKKLFISSFSTSHIDPKFSGDKILVASKYIRPEIVFGETDDIVEIDILKDYLFTWLDKNV